LNCLGCPTKWPATRKNAYLWRPHCKDKSGAQNLQASTIFNFINLTMNGLIEDAQLRDFQNHTKRYTQQIIDRYLAA